MTRPFFAECSKPVAAVANWGVLYNHPVNLNLCKSLRKKTLYEEGRPSVQAINFDGCDATWCFESEGDRDEELRKLIEDSHEVHR